MGRGREAVRGRHESAAPLWDRGRDFGPKTSFAAVGVDRLVDEETVRRVAMSLARDARAFDQQGCNSPHTVFVERGGGVSPAAFAKILAESMEIVDRQNPSQATDPAAIMNVLAIRAEYDIRGEAFYARGGGGRSCMQKKTRDSPSLPTAERSLSGRWTTCSSSLLSARSIRKRSGLRWIDNARPWPRL